MLLALVLVSADRELVNILCRRVAADAASCDFAASCIGCGERTAIPAGPELGTTR